MNDKLSSLKEILELSFSRYITVLNTGFKLPYNDSQIFPALTVSLSSFSSARTLYQNKKPVCRSLDAQKSIKDNKSCLVCLLKNQCTPQIYLELLYDGIPLKLVLAFTSLKNFIYFLNTFNSKLETNLVFTMSVINRGSWGEIKFVKNI